MGLPFAIVAVFVYRTERAFERDGQIARRIVLAKEVNRSRSNNGSTPIEGTSTVDSDAWDDLVEREPVQVAYLPSDPSNAGQHPLAAADGARADGPLALRAQQ